MPLKGLIINGVEVSLEEGSEAADEAGIMPAAAVEAVIQSENQSQDWHSFIGPSKCNPDTTCRREQLIRRFLPYSADPRVFWEAQEGTLYHRILKAYHRKGWYAELTLPPQDGAPEELLKRMREVDIVRIDGKNLYEIFPGIHMMGTLDLLSPDLGDQEDYKGTKFPKYWKGPGTTPKDFRNLQIPDWSVQANIYGYLVEAFFGKFPDRLWVWRVYRGSQSREHTWAKMLLPKIPKAALWNRLAEWMHLFEEKYRQCSEAKDLAEVEQIITTAPLDGKDKAMFNDTKCTEYCPVKRVCDRLADVLVW